MDSEAGESPDSALAVWDSAKPPPSLSDSGSQPSGADGPDSVAIAPGIDAGLDGPGSATSPAMTSPPATMSPPGMVGSSDASDRPDVAHRAGDAGTYTLDAAAVANGRADASDAGTWCAAHMSAEAVDCYDFDEGQPLFFGFASHYFTGNYAGVTSTDFAPGSPPNALLVSTPSLLAGAAPQFVQLSDTLSFHAKVELSFALKVVDYDANAADVSLFRFAFQSGAWAADFDFQQGGAGFVENTPLPYGATKRTVYAAAQPSPADAWTTVDCLYDFANHTVSLSYDGVAVVSNQTIANPSQTDSNILLEMGLNYLGAPAKPMLIYYDDILLTTPQ